MKIAYLGPEGSYSRLAADEFQAANAAKQRKTAFRAADADEEIPFRNFSEVFEAVESGRVGGAAVPIENSLQGGVLQNLDLLQESEDLYAVGECVLRIDHRLIYKSGTAYSEIGRVYSHRQALDQCGVFLAREMPFASLKETESTAFGISRAGEDFSGKSAAIAGAHTARLPVGFVMSDACISDEKNNFTHFLLLRKGRENLPAVSDKIFFSAVCPHRPGGLLELLRCIASNGVNMTKIESRPIKNRPGDYRFFIETEGNIADQKMISSLAEIEEHTLEFKLFGAYKKA